MPLEPAFLRNLGTASIAAGLVFLIMAWIMDNA